MPDRLEEDPEFHFPQLRLPAHGESWRPAQPRHRSRAECQAFAQRLGRRIGGYLDSSLRQDLFGIAGTKGKPLPDTPQWTGSTFLEATFPAFAGWLGTARTDFSYTSGSILAYTVDTPIVQTKTR